MSSGVAIGICLVGLLIFTLNLVHTRSVCDDAYISFRYLDNFLNGHGLVFNPGDRVEGYTNFLWIVVLAPLRLAGVAVEQASLIMTLLTLCILFWAVFDAARNHHDDLIAGLYAITLLAGSMQLAYWSGSGMETILAAALIALAWRWFIVHAKWTPAAAVFLGLAVLTRPPAGTAAIAAVIATFIHPRSAVSENWKRTFGSIALFAAFPLAHTLFRLTYYGDPMPNTFYVKAATTVPGVVHSGLEYLVHFLGSGGGILAVLAIVALWFSELETWIRTTLMLHITLHSVYVISVGGDYFPFQRFLVPVIPALAILAASGVSGLRRRVPLVPAAILSVMVLGCAIGETTLARRSQSWVAAEQLVSIRAEREYVAEWLSRRCQPGDLLAINAAGLIPYRTMLPTIDMLGLNDRHIGRQPVATDTVGSTFVGHFKHDGSYVCSRKPAVVLTSGASLHAGRTADEAEYQAALNTFPGDREFLNNPECRDAYRAVSEELLAGRFVVAFVPSSHRISDLGEKRPSGESARSWFDRGLRHMKNAELDAAVNAFQHARELDPTNPAIVTNLGFCLLDLGDAKDAAQLFAECLSIDPTHFDALYGHALAREKMGATKDAARLWKRYLDEAPEGPWKQRARMHLERLEVSH